MGRTSSIITILLLASTTAFAGTFNPAVYVADPKVDVFTERVARNEFNKRLFSTPYATAVFGNVDVYDRFPYIEARYFQVVSDPAWNRLLMGEIGRGLVAYDGAADIFGRLSAPHGLSSDGLGHIYVADTGNDRVLVFSTSSEFDAVTLSPLYAIEGLSRPYDVAYSDGGTPFDGRDDRLYVANTGRNEVRRYTLGDRSAQFAGAIGELGSGRGRFAGPIAIAVGRHDGAHTDDVYVSDAHNQRFVLLRDTGAGLAWTGAMDVRHGIVTSLDTDQWGNVYATSPQAGAVTKFTPTLFPVARFAAGVRRPRSFHVVFANVTDHRTGARTRAGQGDAVLVDEWGENSGIRLLDLGVEVADAAPVHVDGGAAVSMTLTDRAAVTATLTDPRTGTVVARHDAGVLDAGAQTLRFADDDYVAPWTSGEYRVTVTATSTYDRGGAGEFTGTVELDGSGGPALPARLTLLGNSPNPFNPTTTIRFQVPAGPERDFDVRVYDVRGSLVRRLESGRIGGGTHGVVWNGRNDNGASVSSGIYMVRIEVGAEKLIGKMVLVK